MRYTIGRFAGLHLISKKTLRHYRETGLLEPAGIDPENGYAYYEDAQRERLLRILYLRALRFPLEDIAALLAADGEAWQASVRAQLARVRVEKRALEDVERELGAMLLRKEKGLEVYDQMDMETTFEYRTFHLKEPVMVVGYGRRVPYNKPETKQPMIDALIGSYFGDDMPATIPNRAFPEVGFGIVGEFDPLTGEGLYMMGEQVTGLSEIPEGLRAFTLPVGEYVSIMFRAKDKPTLTTEAMDTAYRKLYDEWLPASGYKEVEMMAVEVYRRTEFEVPANPCMEIWTRIVPKERT